MRTIEANLPHAEAELADRVNTLFGRHPELLGFRIEEGSDASLAVQVLLFPPVSNEDYDALSESISVEMSEFVSSRPEAVDLMRGRIFTRTLH